MKDEQAKSRSFDEKLKQLQSSYDQLTTDFQSQRSQLSQQTDTNENLSQTLSKKDTEIASLNEKLLTIQKELELNPDSATFDDVLAKIRDSKQNLDSLSKTNKNLEDRIEELKQQSGKANDHIEKIKSTFDEKLKQMGKKPSVDINDIPQLMSYPSPTEEESERFSEGLNELILLEKRLQYHDQRWCLLGYKGPIKESAVKYIIKKEEELENSPFINEVKK